MRATFLVCIFAIYFQVLEATNVRHLAAITPKRLSLPSDQPPPFQNLKFDMHRSFPNAGVPATRDMRAEGCGIPNPPANRIVGGWEAGVNEFPWQVAIFIDNIYFCGGSLIANDWVLTAANCAEDAKVFNILLGAHNIRVPEPDRAQVNATEYYIHPGWNSFTRHNDIALIKLPQPVPYSNIIRPICLPTLGGPADDHVGEAEVLTGWGRPSDSEVNISPVLRKTNVTVISLEECSGFYDNIVSSQLCGSTLDGHGSCDGDSGGPLSHVDNGFFEQIGIASFGSPLGCEVGAPVAFTSVEAYLEWISAITGIIV